MDCRAILRHALIAFVLLVPGARAQAQQADTTTLVTATLTDSDANGYQSTTDFTCRGTPTCTGSYSEKIRDDNCPNFYTTGGDFTMTGLNLAQSGAIQGTIIVTDYATVHLPGGACAPSTQFTQETLTYVGTWNRATGIGTLTVTGIGGANDVFQLTFRADVTATAPVFPMTVRAQIGPQTSTITADIQFRAADVGRNGSVYVFAQAPASIVRGATVPKADPAACTLAQLSSTGELTSVSLAQLKAFTTGAFAAAGESVAILNGTPTPNIAGATFYVGYGSTGPQMLSDGIFRNAAIIPGSGTCPPLPYQTALWWNPAESGWGLNLNHQGNIVFATLFTYDATRAPLWLVMSAGAMQSDGLTFAGDLFRTTGPAFNASPFTPIGPANVTQVGTMSIAFTEANAATLRYTMNGVEVVKSIQRQVFGSRAANCLPTVESRASLTNYQDLWWIPSESGWGINLTHQDNTIFATLFTYDSAGRGMWLVLSNGARQADGSYSGDLFKTTGSPFNSVPFTPIGGSDVTNVGTMRLRFTDGNNGTLTYTYLGTSVTKAITRQVFSSPVSACN